MATSEVELCNRALAHIRAGAINSFADNSAQGILCSLIYPPTRDELLIKAPWDFATGISLLTLRSDTVFNYAYLYQYPVDALKLNRLMIDFTRVQAGQSLPFSGNFNLFNQGLIPPDLNRQVEHKVMTVAGLKVIAANYPRLRSEHVLKVTDVTLFSVEFDSALTHLLASKLAIPLVGGSQGDKYQQTEYSLYMQVLGEAIATSLNESYTPTPESELVTIRMS